MYRNIHDFWQLLFMRWIYIINLLPAITTYNKHRQNSRLCEESFIHKSCTDYILFYIQQPMSVSWIRSSVKETSLATSLTMFSIFDQGFNPKQRNQTENPIFNECNTNTKNKIWKFAMFTTTAAAAITRAAYAMKTTLMESAL